MSILEAVILGLIQGLTEFLPISSSGHLVILQNLLGIEKQGILFEVMVHFGTLLAVFFVFKDDIIKLIKNPFQKITLLIIAGTIPTAFIGFAFEDAFENMFSSLYTVGFTLIITGTLLLLSERLSKGSVDFKGMRFVDALIIGMAQGAAITPGISRSGSTIAVAMLLGLNRRTAAKYSFLLSIPAVLGATILESKELLSGVEVISIIPILIGTVVSTISGYFAIKVLLKVLEKGKLTYFSLYCWVVGTIIIFSYIF